MPSLFDALTWLIMLELLMRRSSSAMASDDGEQDNVCSAIQTTLDLPAYDYARWGLLLADSESGEVLQSLNPDEMIEIASVMKIFTMAAAMEVIGSNHVFETPVVHTGELADGVLDGDLILVTQGDLTMGGRNNSDGSIEYTLLDHTQTVAGAGVLTKADPLAGLNALAEQVKTEGISSVTGNVIIDDRLFDTFNLLDYFVSPIIINDNLIDISCAATQSGEAATVTLRPQSAAYRLEANVTTRDIPTVPVTVQAEKGNDGVTTITVQGDIVTDSAFAFPPYLITYQVGKLAQLNEAQQIEEIASFARTLFIEALVRAGVQVSAELLGPNPSQDLPASLDGLPQVAMLYSPPFSEYMKLILKVSHNLGAYLTATLMGVAAGQRPYYLGGMVTLGQILMGTYDLNKDAYAFQDAAGDQCFATPRLVVDLLTKLEERPDFEALKAGLPILGVDGSLATTLQEHPAAGKVYAKLGTNFIYDFADLQLVVRTMTLAGYMDAQDGSRRRRFFAGASPANTGDSLEAREFDGAFAIIDNVAQVSADMWTTACVEESKTQTSGSSGHTWDLYPIVAMILLASC